MDLHVAKELRRNLHCPDRLLQIVKLIVDARMASSNAEARRLIIRGDVKIDGVKVAEPKAALCAGTYVVQVGKLRAANVALG